MKKILFLILIMSMLIGCLNITAYASDENSLGGYPLSLNTKDDPETTDVDEAHIASLLVDIYDQQPTILFSMHQNDVCDKRLGIKDSNGNPIVVYLSVVPYPIGANIAYSKYGEVHYYYREITRGYKNPYELKINDEVVIGYFYEVFTSDYFLEEKTGDYITGEDTNKPSDENADIKQEESTETVVLKDYVKKLNTYIVVNSVILGLSVLTSVFSLVILIIVIEKKNGDCNCNHKHGKKSKH